MKAKQKVPDIVKGHEIWLEPTHLHYHSGGEVEVKALWGHMMQRDGMGRSENWKAYVIEPGGTRSEIVPDFGEGLFHVLAFSAGQEGIYTVVVENDAGIFKVNDGRAYYYQWAKLMVPVGHHIHGSGAAQGGGLDIVPEEFKEYRLGDNIHLKVYYKGKPLIGAAVKATFHLYTGSEYPVQLSTDAEGAVSFSFDQKGHWMFYVSHRDDAMFKEGEYEGMQLASTIVIPGVR